MLKDEVWNKKFNLAKAYYEEHGDLLIPNDYMVNGIRLGRWIQTQRDCYLKKNNCLFTEERIDKLNSIDMVWDYKSYCWNRMFNALVVYKNTFNSLLVPQTYITSDNLHLGIWVNSQRLLHRKNILEKNKVIKLDSIDFVWDPFVDIHNRWDIIYEKVKEYKLKYNKFPYYDKKLNNWLYLQRHKISTNSILPERLKKLEDIGFIKKKFDTWEINYSLLKDMYNKHGSNCYKIVLVDKKLNNWIKRQRFLYKNKKLSDDKTRKLMSINFDFDFKNNYWISMYNKAKKFYEINKNLNVSKNKNTSTNYELGVWLDGQRYLYRKKRLSSEKIELLEKINVKWNLYRDPYDIWNEWYLIAKKFYLENGHLCPKKGRLATWLFAQRAAKKGLRGKITSRQIKLLNNIGMIWDVKKEHWEEMYNYAKEYYNIHKLLNIPCNYVTDNGVNLGIWISKQRRVYKDIINQKIKLNSIIKNRIKLLNDIDMIWDASKISSSVSFQEKAVFYYMKKFFNKVVKITQWEFIGYELDVYIPDIKTAIEYDGIMHIDKLEKDNLKNKACKDNNIRIIRIREGKLPEVSYCDNVIVAKTGKDNDLENAINKLLMLLNIDYICDIKKDKKEIIETYKNYSSHKFDKNYELVYLHYKKFGSIDNDSSFSCLDKELKLWLLKQRSDYKNGLLTKLQLEKLKKVGFILDIYEEKWMKNYNLALDYYKKNNKIEFNCITDDGFHLGAFLYKQKRLLLEGKLENNKVKLLEQLDIDYLYRDVKKEKMEHKNKCFNELDKYYKNFGNINIKVDYVSNGIPLGKWIRNIRERYKKGLLDTDTIEIFNSYNMIWDVFDDIWEEMFNCAKKYYEKYNNLFVTTNYIAENGKNLYGWITLQRKKYFRSKLSKEQIDKLNSINIIWDPYTYKWMKNYELAKEYYKEHGNLNIPVGFITDSGVKLGMWIGSQRQANRGNPNFLMTEERKRLLDLIHMDWTIKRPNPNAKCRKNWI